MAVVINEFEVVPAEAAAAAGAGRGRPRRRRRRPAAKDPERELEQALRQRALRASRLRGGLMADRRGAADRHPQLAPDDRARRPRERRR